MQARLIFAVDAIVFLLSGIEVVVFDEAFWSQCSGFTFSFSTYFRLEKDGVA